MTAAAEPANTRWLSPDEQAVVIGRRKSDSLELEPKAADSHVASTDQDVFGKIFRRNMPYGTVTDHGTMFVGFSSEQAPLANMLNSMAGLHGVRDARVVGRDDSGVAERWLRYGVDDNVA